MKKIAVLLLSVMLFVMPSLVCASAADMADGTYEVPVTLMHKEDEKESFGNKYVAPTALLKVENGKKTVTLLLTTDMKGIAFSYYINGSLEGDVAEATPVSGVTVKGETYEQGFDIPVMAEGDIGLKFSIPVMPMSPSARLRIDYANAVSVSGGEVTTTAQPSTTQTTTTTQPIVTTTAPTTSQVAATTTSVTTTAATTIPTTVATTAAQTTAQTATSAQSTVSQDAQEEKSPSFGSIAIMIVVVILASAIATYLFDRKKGDKKQ